MADPAPLFEEEHVQVFPHGNKAFPKDKSFIVQDPPKRGTVDFLQNASLTALKSVFKAAANDRISEPQNPNRLMILHAMDPNSDTDNTNSSRDYFHLHVFPEGVNQTHPHVLENTSYAPRPNQENLAETLADNDNLNAEQATFTSLDLNDETGREALYHKIIAAKKFTSFEDFCETATDNEWEEFRVQLLEAATGVEDGVRFIFRNDQAGFFQVQALGGENLAQDGQVNAKNGAPGRWFDEVPEQAL